MHAGSLASTKEAKELPEPHCKPQQSKQKQISDLKEIVCPHIMYLKTLPINRFNSIKVCSLTAEKLATKPARVFLKTNGAKTLEILLAGSQRKGIK